MSTPQSTDRLVLGILYRREEGATSTEVDIELDDANPFAAASALARLRHDGLVEVVGGLVEVVGPPVKWRLTAACRACLDALDGMATT